MGRDQPVIVERRILQDLLEGLIGDHPSGVAFELKHLDRIDIYHPMGTPLPVNAPLYVVTEIDGGWKAERV